jgi:PAS domain S-box-containing protein
VSAFNRRFGDMWRIPEPLLETKDDAKLLQFVLDQLEDPVEFFTKVQQLYSEPETQSFDAIKFKDGRVFERYSQPQRIGQQIAGRVWSFRDISERKRVEEALANERNVLRTLIDNLPDNIFVKDVDSRFVVSNLAHARLLRAKTPDEIVGKTDFDIFPPELAGSYYADEQAVIQSGQPLLNREERTIDPEGKTRWYLTTKVPLRDDQGKVVGLAGVNRDITERKRVEEALANERNVLRTLIDNLPDNIFIKDAESRFVTTNLVHVHHLRAKTLDEVVGKTDFDIYPRELAASYYADEQAVIQSGQPLVNREERTIDPEGKTRWYLTTKVPLRDDQGKVIGIVGVNRDITERKAAEEELRKLSQFRETIIDNADVWLDVLDEKANVVIWNKAAEAISGYSREEVVGHGKIWEWLYPDEEYRKQLTNSVAEVRRGRVDQNFETAIRRKDDQTRIISWNERNLLDEHGKPVGSIAIGRDVTEHKRMEEKVRQYSSNLEQIVAERTSKLAESERRFRELVDLLPQIVFETDENGAIQFMNRAGFEATGRTEEELRRGLNMFQTFAVDDTARERIGRMMTGEKLGGREVTVLRRDGTTFPAMTYAAPIMREGKAVGLRGIAVDITERERLEAQLVESQRLAAIGETAMMVGHDLRNPLQAMTGTLYVAKGLAASDNVADRKEAVGLLGTLEDEIQYMDKIVSDLQDYARPVGAELVETSLPDLVREAASNAKIPSNVEVAVNVQSGLSNVKLDPALFRRVLTNLILNAVQAMPKGGKLTIAGSRGDGSLTVAVQDTGVGIAPENLGRVFTPFFTTKAKGQGLGLAVCKRLTEAQGGTINVTSRVGEGSTFTIKISTNRER